MKLNPKILLFQGSQALSSMLIASFVTMFLLQGVGGIQNVAYGSILISCMTLLGFILVNILSRYYRICLSTPISLSGWCISCIGAGLYFFPEYGRFFYGLFGLSVGLYYSGANLIMIQEVDVSIRAYHTAVMQTIGGIIGVGGPLLLGVLFSLYGSEYTYRVVFIAIMCSGVVAGFAGLLFKTRSLFEHHSLHDMILSLPKINKWYFVMIGAMGAGALKSQLDIIIPHTINLSEVNISYILAGLKLISLIIVYFSGRFLQTKYYRLFITTSIGLLSLGTLGFIIFYNTYFYSAFAMTSVVGSTMFAFVYTVISARWVELMKVSNRAIGLRGEIIMAIVRVVLACIMFFSASGVVVGKAILMAFMLCLIIGSSILYKKSQKLFPLA